MRALVVGASGQLGGHLLGRLRADGHLAIGTYASHAVPGLVKVELEDRAALRAALLDVRPDVVIVSAGWTWVDGCEDDPERCQRLNCDVPLDLARLAAEQGALFVVYSTDYVFDGEAGPYREDAPVRPLSAYGRAKADMEAKVRALGDDHLILRTTTVFGPERQGKNFVYQLVQRLRAGQPFRVPTDQVASPSYGPDVAAATLALIEQGARGTWHVAGPDPLDRAAFADRVCAAFGLDPAAIERLPTAALSQKAARPLSAALDTSKLRAAGIEVRGVDAALAAMRAAIEADPELARL